MKKSALYILDSYGLIYRAYYSFVSRPLMNEKGENVSAVFGFFRNFLRILKDYEPQFAVAALDSKTPTFRHKMYDQYKATRQKTPDDLKAQIPVIEQILTELGIPILRCDGYEADDIIATLAEQCKKEGRECRILSGDKDLMQLVDDYVHILKPDKSGGWETIDTEGVITEWGVNPSLMLDLLALTGDTADNIPGVKGVGEKTAVKYLDQYGSLDGIFEHAEEIGGAIGNKIREGKEMAYFSQDLVRLHTEVPINTDINSYALNTVQYAKAAQEMMSIGIPAVAKSYAEIANLEAISRGEKPLDSLAGFDTKNTTTKQTKQNESQPSMASTLQTADPDPVFETLIENTGEYRAITDKEELHRIVTEILASGEVAFDCETDGLNTHKVRLVGFSLSNKTGSAVYIPLITPDSGTLLSPQLIEKKEALVELERIFSDPSMCVIAHNAKFDYEVLRSNGLSKPNCTFADTMIAAWLLNPERASFSLEALALSKLGLKTIPFTDLVPKKEKDKTFADVPLEKAVPYASEDADLTWQLWQIFKPLLEKEKLDELFYKLEMPLMPILAEMEINGIHIDKNTLCEYAIELQKQIEILEKQIYDIVGHEFNIASTKQLQEVLFTELQLPTGKKTKTGFSTDTAVLEELAKIHAVPQKILDFRTLSKLLSTYVEALPVLSDENDRIHTSFMQTGTATGRLSSREPNLQNIPIRDDSGRRIRSAFTAKDGFMLISADYSQIELVILAHLSEDHNLRRAFNEGADVHKTTASLIFGVPPQEVTADMRRTAKTINFGVMYGMSAFRLSNELGIPRAQANDFIEAYFTTYSGIQNFIHSTVEKAEQSGYVETILGRRRYIHAINSKNKLEKSGAERMAVNTPIQGSAADIVKTAMLSLNDALQKSKKEGKFAETEMLLQVHDELIFECKKEDCAELCELIRQKMEGAISLSIPLRVSVESGTNWGMFH